VELLQSNLRLWPGEKNKEITWALRANNTPERTKYHLSQEEYAAEKRRETRRVKPNSGGKNIPKRGN